MTTGTIQAVGYDLPVYTFHAPPEITLGARRRYPVVIVGAGLAGLTVACDLAVRGVETLLLDEDNTIGVRGAASRGICYAQKSLEIFARLGIYERIRAKGVQWSSGKTLAGRDIVYSFDLAAASLSQQPPFINIQQFYIEWFLVDRLLELGRTQLRWLNNVVGIRQNADCVSLSVETPAGRYELETEWLLDASGVNSVIREAFALPTHPARGQDRWCISDIRFKHTAPLERWTWIAAPFNEDRAVWQHPMADEVWRLDYQMDANADPAEVSRIEVVVERLREQLGADIEFELVWVGPYAYRTQMLDQFRHGRVFFLGDCAHVMSPFGARGGNSAIQDAENLAWKLALVLKGEAPERLLDSYCAERQPAAVHNIQVTSRTTRFLSPESPAERLIRDAVVALAREHPFARALVNTGRMSVPFVYERSPVIEHAGVHVQNVPIRLPDARLGCLLDLFGAEPAFVAILMGGDATALVDAETDQVLRKGLLKIFNCGENIQFPSIVDVEGKLVQALQADRPGLYLIRPDLHLAAFLDQPSSDALRAALRRALADAGPNSRC
jgi:3-(3-hydroxy-phenyl)propionate hydroxylase